MKRIEELIEMSEKVTDPRRKSGNYRHKLTDIIVIGLLTTICVGEDFTDMESFGKERKDWLKDFLELPNGIPELLDLIDVSGGIVTADAMSCQKVICGKIVAGKADFVIGLKENQPSLLDDVRLYFEEFETETDKTATLEKDHGRIERRRYYLETNIEWLEQKPLWCGLNGIGMVKSCVLEKGITREESRYFITSLTDVNEFARAVREHWGIENGLHWHLDVIFGEDKAQQKKDNSPLNMNVLRKVALNLLKSVNWGRIGIKKKMFIAALNPLKLQEVIFGIF
jgi:predicted transposase YbfD/YdcC